MDFDAALFGTYYWKGGLLMKLYALFAITMFSILLVIVTIGTICIFVEIILDTGKRVFNRKKKGRKNE